MGQFDVDIKALRMYSDDLNHYEDQTANYRERAEAATVDAQAWSTVGLNTGELYEWTRKGVEGGLIQSARFLAGMRGRVLEAAEIYRSMDWQAKESFDALNKDLDDIARNVRVGGTFAGIGQMIGNPHGHLAPAPVLRGDFADFGKDAYARGKEQSIDTAGATSPVREVITEGIAFVNECQGHVQAAVGHPLRFLAAAGLGFLLGQVQPLQQLADAVEGNPDALQKTAAVMREIDEGLQHVRTDFDRVTSTRLTGWNGAAAQAAKARLTDYAIGLSSVAVMADLIERILETTALVLKTIDEAVKSILTDLVIQLIQLWIPALQSAAATMGASISQAYANTQVMVSLTTVKVVGLLGKLLNLMAKIGEVLNNLGSHFSGAVPQLSQKSKQRVTRDRKAPREDARALKVVD